MGSTIRWYYSSFLGFFPLREQRTSVWNVSAIHNLYAKNTASVLMTFWAHSNMDAKTKKVTSHQCFFLSHQVLLKMIFRKRGGYFFAKRQFFKSLSLRKWKTSFSQNFTTWKKNVLKNLFRSIPSTSMIFKCNFSHLQRCSRSISFLLHSMACLQ